MPFDLKDQPLVTRSSSLKALTDRLSQETILAVDTESNSLHAYQEQVCLIQFSTPDEDFLVDPLALDNLSPLAPIFANPAIEKVFHAAEYDLICLSRDFGFQFENLFDTMIAASILGRGELGLGSLLEAEFGVQVQKRFQRANWGKRPLPAELIDYANMDTHYLIPLRHSLRLELESAGRWPLAVEDFHHLGQISLLLSDPPAQNGEKPAGGCWRISGAIDLPPQQAAVLQELCHYRDVAAHSLNRPLFKVISDATLLAVAAACPTRLDELKGLPGMTAGQIRRHGLNLLLAVQKGLQAPPIFRPRSRRPNEAYLSRLEALRRLRKDLAEAMGVKSDVVLPRDLMLTLAAQNPRHSEELATLMADFPWRLEHFGSQILKAISNA